MKRIFLISLTSSIVEIWRILLDRKNYKNLINKLYIIFLPIENNFKYLKFKFLK